MKTLWQKFQDLDPRIPVAFILFTYLVLGLTVLGFNRSPWQAVTTTLLCISLEMLLTRIFYAKWIFPLSALITSFSLSFLLNYSHSSAMILLPVLLAIGSKYLLRYNGKHFFNPALFAVAMSLLISKDLITAAPAYQWNGIGAMSAFVVMLGLMFVLPKVNRHWLVISFLTVFTLQTALRAWIMRHHLPFDTLFYGTLSSPSFFIFTFFMITDPATSPKARRDQILVGAAIAFVDLLFHIIQSYYTFFFAAFTVATCRFIYFHVRDARKNGLIAPNGYWKQAATVIGLFLLFNVGYSRVLYPAVLAPTPGFRLEKMPATHTGLDADKQGDIISRVDSRVQHIAKWYLAETNGIAVGDYDSDGKQDVVMVQPLRENAERIMLYRNAGDHKFEKVPVPVLDPIREHPEELGIPSNAMFVDYDNDGDQDLFITVVHGSVLLLRNDTGQFVDVTKEAGLEAYAQSISATFADFNRDGLVDLFLANVLEENLPDYDPPVKLNMFRLPKQENADDNRPFNFMHASWNLSNNGGQNKMYFQTAEHRFVQQPPELWGGMERRWSLALGAADLNRDGWIDLYVANDFGPDEMYYNKEGKGFEQIKGSTFGSVGLDTYKGMNVSVADYDRTGWLGVYVSNVHHALQAEGSLLWAFSPGTDPRYPILDEVATQRNALNEERFGWGATAADFDNDGWIDLAQANGMVSDRYDKKFEKCPDYWYVNEKIARSPPNIHRHANKWGDIRGYCIFGWEKNRVYLNRGPKASPQFVDVAAVSGASEETNSRSAVTGDFENNGRLDLIFTHPFEQPTFYNNVAAADDKSTWAGLVLQGNGKTCNRDALNSRVDVSITHQDGQVTKIAAETQLVSGLLGQSDRRLHFGLGTTAKSARAEILWCGHEKDSVELVPGKYTLHVQR